MNLIGLLVVLIVVGVILWLINAYVPMAPPFKTIVNIVAVIFILLWLLQVFGLLGSIGTVRVR